MRKRLAAVLRHICSIRLIPVLIFVTLNCVKKQLWHVLSRKVHTTFISFSRKWLFKLRASFNIFFQSEDPLRRQKSKTAEM